jgi:hypothetical protein
VNKDACRSRPSQSFPMDFSKVVGFRTAGSAIRVKEIRPSDLAISVD